MGGIWGVGWAGLEECQYVGMYLSVCTYVCDECGEMCNLKLVMCLTGRAPQPLSSGALPKGFFLLSLRGTHDARQVLITSEKLACFVRPFSQKRRAGLRFPNPHSRGSGVKSWFYTNFVIFRFLELTVNSCGRKCLALKLSCIVCASAHLPPFLRLMVELGENRVLKSCLWLLPAPQSCYGSLSLIRKVLVTWLFGLLRVRMARPLRGHAWPGGCASTSKIIITAIQNCLIGSSSQEICEHVSLCQHHLLPPASTP